MSSTSCFSFGPEDSFISRSFEGLRYRDLPQSLHQLIVAGSVLDVHWAALGPVKESWVLNFQDATGKDNLAWGEESPSKLQDILKKTPPSPHIRVFLGPLARFNAVTNWLQDSFIAWDAAFIRWQGLPPELEECLQGWLTPSGWRAGPPRIVTWGPKEAFFAMSEYGEVGCYTGLTEGGEPTWPIFKETVEEWRAEKGFSWGDLAYIVLDPTVPDQFLAIRQDGSWSGSIDDINEDALETFARNYLKLAKPRSKSKSHARTESQANNARPNGTTKPADTIPEAAAQALYEQWATDVASSFAAALAANTAAKPKAPRKLEVRSQSQRSGIPSYGGGGKLLATFPYLPATITTCKIQYCIGVKADPAGLKACKHDVERLFRASGMYSVAWLRQERLRWHPDRFGRLCEENFRDVGRKLAEEVFKIIDVLISELEERGSAI
ncbi:hypothetical protein BDV96DRAFT_690527 [Lophiotrema nucula]|uniref:Uncharacterized protein n=1 Tax=Lophiotrema nucula TaxID=690887 RepID=A0A6A5YWZ9_9PLEO|nr:hypothetical protein BDV96DRAFT_690527 [Lophiotrema nucula]